MKRNIVLFLLFSFSIVSAQSENFYDLLVKSIPEANTPKQESSWNIIQNLNSSDLKENSSTNEFYYNYSTNLVFEGLPTCKINCEKSISFIGKSKSDFSIINIKTDNATSIPVDLEKLLGRNKYNVKQLRKVSNNSFESALYELSIPGKSKAWVNMSKTDNKNLNIQIEFTPER